MSGSSAGIASRANRVETSSAGITTIPSSPSGGSNRAANSHSSSVGSRLPAQAAYASAS